MNGVQVRTMGVVPGQGEVSNRAPHRRRTGRSVVVIDPSVEGKSRNVGTIVMIDHSNRASGTAATSNVIAMGDRIAMIGHSSGANETVVTSNVIVMGDRIAMIGHSSGASAIAATSSVIAMISHSNGADEIAGISNGIAMIGTPQGLIVGPMKQRSQPRRWRKVPI
jgi:hypothetical protein